MKGEKFFDNSLAKEEIVNFKYQILKRCQWWGHYASVLQRVRMKLFWDVFTAFSKIGIKLKKLEKVTFKHKKAIGQNNRGKRKITNIYF
jgi:hypothetical protein